MTNNPAAYVIVLVIGGILFVVKMLVLFVFKKVELRIPPRK